MSEKKYAFVRGRRVLLASGLSTVLCAGLMLGALTAAGTGTAAGQSSASAAAGVDKARASDLQNWWKNAVFYEIYPRSFQDSNGDGHWRSERYYSAAGLSEEAGR